MSFKKMNRYEIVSRLDRILVFLMALFVYFNIIYFEMDTLGLGFLLVIIIYIVIYTVIELIFKNSIFKYLLGYKIVTLTDGTPNSRQIFIRNIMRVVDDILLIGRFAVYFDKRKRRLGDIMAGTKIVERKNSDSVL